MIRFFKWFNSKIENSNGWLLTYCIILWIFLKKIYDTMSDKVLYIFSCVILLTIMYFFIRLMLKEMKNNCKCYKKLMYFFTIIYVIGTPVYCKFFLIRHPLLANIIVGIIFLVFIYLLLKVHVFLF